MRKLQHLLKTPSLHLPAMNPVNDQAEELEAATAEQPGNTASVSGNLSAHTMLKRAEIQFRSAKAFS